MPTGFAAIIEPIAMTRRCLSSSVLVMGLLLGVIACAGDSRGATRTATPSTPSPATETLAPQPIQPPQTSTRLALVFVDTSRGQTADLYVGEMNGTEAHLVASLDLPARALGVAGTTVAMLDSNNQIVFIDLVRGERRAMPAPAGVVFDARFVDETTFLYSVGPGCAHSGTQGRLMAVVVSTLVQRELHSNDLSLTIAGVEASTGEVALVPRGCDPSVNSVVVHSIADGAEIADVPAAGCGWVVAAPAIEAVIVSWLACTPLPREAADATIYRYAEGAAEARSVTAPGGGANMHPFLFRPGADEAALGTTVTEGAGPGSASAGGIWLLSLATLDFELIVPAEGAEQFPVQWSADGRYLLYGTVLAQGLCRYGIVDTQNLQLQLVPEAIQFCGINGNVVGWATLME